MKGDGWEGTSAWSRLRTHLGHHFGRPTFPLRVFRHTLDASPQRVSFHNQSTACSSNQTPAHRAPTKPPTMKTYSRLKKTTYLSIGPPAKRRRILSDNDDDALQLSSDAAFLRNDAPSPPRSSLPRETSDAVLPSSTPPSSPPPAPPPVTSTSPLALPKRRPTFSFFARKAATAARSADSNNNTTKPSPRPPAKQPNDSVKEEPPAPAATENKKRPQQRRFTQLQLDLGSAPVQRTCKTCGMAFVPSNAEDATLHKRFHAMHVGGVEVGRAFGRGGGGGGGAVKGSGEVVWEKGVDGDMVVAVGRRDRAAAKTRVKRVLEVVERELGAVEIPEAELWSEFLKDGGDKSKEESASGTKEKEIGLEPQRSGTANGTGPKKVWENTMLRTDRFKAYLYVRSSKCIGLCLAERICKAYEVTATPQDSEDSLKTSHAKTDTASLDKSHKSAPSTLESSVSTAITTSPTPQGAHTGISRIWVSSSHRRQGVATALLDAVNRDFCCSYFHEVEKRTSKEGVAFSQPTESGARLARRWFGSETGWAVYW